MVRAIPFGELQKTWAVIWGDTIFLLCLVCLADLDIHCSGSFSYLVKFCRDSAKHKENVAGNRKKNKQKYKNLTDLAWKTRLKMKPAVQRPSKPRSVYWLKWLVPRETVHFVSRDSRGIKFLPRDQSLRNLLYSWKFIKPRCKGGRRSTVAGNSVLLPLDFAALRAQRFLRETVSFEGRSSQLYTQLMQLRNESRKKVRACTGFEPLTSAIRVQRSTN